MRVPTQRTYALRSRRTIAGAPLSPHTRTSPSPSPESSLRSAKKPCKRVNPRRRARNPTKAFSKSTSMSSSPTAPVETAFAAQQSNVAVIRPIFQNRLALTHLVARLKARNAKLLGRLETAWAGVVEHASCAICHDIATQPYCLPSCGHSFCWPCLQLLFKNNIKAHALRNNDIPSDLKKVIRTKGVNDEMIVTIRRYFPRTRFPRCTCPLCRVKIDAVPMQVAALSGTIVGFTKSASVVEGHSSRYCVWESGSFDNVFHY